MGKRQDKLLYFDLETTGTNPAKHGVIQIGAILEIGGDEIDTFVSDVAPHKNDLIDAAALRVTNTNPEDLHKRPAPKDVLSTFVAWLGKAVDRYNKEDKLHLVGYNCQGFDIPFLRQWFTKGGENWFGSYFWHPGLDVMILAADYVAPYRHTISSFKLAEICRVFGIETEEDKLHDALYDVRLTRDLYNIINHLRDMEGGTK